jgi:NADPH:quinone reductase-like Zn-dependent oxidoreductase
MRRGKALEYDRYGDAEELHFVPQSMPSPDPDEVVVEVVAAALNHMDVYVRRGDFADEVPAAFPSRQGTCFAGIVRAKGAAVKEFAVGADVLGHDPSRSAHASFVRLPATALVRKPAALSWEVAGSLYLAGTTALSLVAGLRLGPEDLVLITAAAGGVGHIECQLAKLAGASVLGVAGADNHDYLRSIGVIPVGHGDDLAARIRTAAKDRQVTAVLDNYAGYEALAAELGVPAGRFVSSDQRRQTELRFYLAPGDDREARTMLADIAELVATWGIRVLISGFYAFDQLPEALADLEARHSRGKVIVGMHTSAPAETYLGRKLRSVHA